MNRVATILGFLVVMALAIFFRVHHIDTTPPGFFIDEAEDALDAWSIGRDAGFPAYIEEPQLPPRSREPLFHYIMAATFAVFGTNITSVRLAPALIGIATVLIYYIVCVRHLGVRLAFLAAGLLAVSRWYVTFSRVGMRAITTTFCIALVLLGVSFLIKKRSIVSAGFLGFALALGFYSYPSYWIVPLPIAVILLLAMRHDPDRSVAGYTKLAAAAAIGFLVTIAPLAHYALTRPEIFFARALETSAPLQKGPGPAFQLRDNAQRTLFMLHFRGDPQSRHNIPNRPQLDPLTGIAFAAGLYWLLRTFRDQMEIKLTALMFWLLLLLPSIVTLDAPHAMRGIGAVLAVCVIAAMGFDLLSRAAAGSDVLRRAAVPALIPIVILTAVAGWNYHNYFRVWANDPVVYSDFSGPLPKFHTFYSELRRGNDVWVSPYIFHSPQLKFMTIAEGKDMQQIVDASAFRAPLGAKQDRVIVCDSAAVNFALEKLYPQAEKLTTYRVYGASVGRVWKISKEALRASLTPEEEAEINFVVSGMVRDSEEQRKRW